jgi:hypothetical protein
MKMVKGLKRMKRAKRAMKVAKLHQHPVWKFVTKVEDGRGGETVKFFCPRDFHDGKPFNSSYTRMRRHLCCVMDNDDRKGAIGITICPKMFKEERQKYIKRKLHKESMVKNKSFTPMPHLNLVATHLHLMVLEPLDLEEQ